MARLTPLNYNQQVVNPMQMALQGYQAGFGQMQQLDEVRRQREADEMNRQQFAQQTEMNQLQMDEYRRKTAQAERSQAVLGEFVARFDSENPPSAQEIQMFMLENPEYAEQLSSVYGAMSEDEQAQSIQSNATMYSFARSEDEEGLRNYLGRTLEAAKNSGDANTAQAITADLKLLDTPGGLSNIAAMSAVALSATEGGRSALNTLTPEAEERTALMKNIDARLEAEAAAGNIGPRGSDTWNQRAAELFEQASQKQPGFSVSVINEAQPLGGTSGEPAPVVGQGKIREGHVRYYVDGKFVDYQVGGPEFIQYVSTQANQARLQDYDRRNLADSIIDLADEGLLIDEGGFVQYVKGFFRPALAQIQGGKVATAEANRQAIGTRAVMNFITEMGITGKGFDTPAEFQRYFEALNPNNKIAALQSIHAMDLVAGNSGQIKRLFNEGKITAEEYADIIQQGSGIAQSFVTQFKSSYSNAMGDLPESYDGFQARLNEQIMQLNISAELVKNGHKPEVYYDEQREQYYGRDQDNYIIYFNQ